MKRLILCLSGLLLLFALLYLCPYPQKVDAVLDGFYYEQKSESPPQLGAPGSVRIQGTLYRYLIKDDVFKGKICLGGSLCWEGLSSTGAQKLQNGFSLFTFAIYNEGDNRPGAVSLYKKGNFQKVLLDIYTGVDSVRFAAPAEEINDLYLD